ncbi:MAG: T9SS type A sorting domain-containing protein, partial [Bacteroidia bacterium]
LAIAANGTLWAWGDNTYAQFGNASTTWSNIPVQTGNNTADWGIPVTDINHSGILKTDGSLWLCGDNYYGQLGHNLSLSQNVFMLLGCPFTTVGMSETQINTNPEVFPNPASDYITLSGFAANEPVAVYSAQGQLMMRCVAGNTINISELPAGLYVIRSQRKSVRVLKR